MTANLARRVERLEVNQPAARVVLVWDEHSGPNDLEAATVAACAAAGVDRRNANIITIGWADGIAA